MLIIYISNYFTICWASQLVLMLKNLPDNPEEVRDVDSIPGLRRSPGGGHGNPLQYPCQENPIDTGAWWTIVHRVANSRAWLKRQLAYIQLLYQKLKTVILSLWWYIVEVSWQFRSDQMSRLVLSDSLRPHESQHARPPVHHQLPEFTQTHVHWVGDAIQPSHPLSSPSPPAPNPSQHQSLFQWVNSSHEVAKYWSFSFSISPSKEHPGLIPFRMDWLDLLAVQGTLKSLLQHHSLKASILRRSAFFTVQLSHPYMTTGP